eukprot:1194537-Prorocentrum_minimum.AAC.7
MGLERGLDPVTRGDAACRMNRVADEKEAKFREMAAKVLTPLEDPCNHNSSGFARWCAACIISLKPLGRLSVCSPFVFGAPMNRMLMFSAVCPVGSALGGVSHIRRSLGVDSVYQAGGVEGRRCHQRAPCKCEPPVRLERPL